MIKRDIIIKSIGGSLFGAGAWQVVVLGEVIFTAKL